MSSADTLVIFFVLTLVSALLAFVAGVIIPEH
jgi:hypothetical protein